MLRSYGGAYTGRYTNETFPHWDFAAPTEKELPAITQFFDVGVTPGDNKTLTHSLSTVLIGKDGKVVAWYPEQRVETRRCRRRDEEGRRLILEWMPQAVPLI